ILGSHCAISPGARTIPAAMVLPTAAAIPNQTPRTFSSPPRERAASAAPTTTGPIGATGVVVDASDVLDNGVTRGACSNVAIIVSAPENASRKSCSGNDRQCCSG